MQHVFEEAFGGWTALQTCRNDYKTPYYQGDRTPLFVWSGTSSDMITTMVFVVAIIAILISDLIISVVINRFSFFAMITTALNPKP